MCLINLNSLETVQNTHLDYLGQRNMYIYTLGIYINGKELDHYKMNFKPRIEKISSLLILTLYTLSNSIHTLYHTIKEIKYLITKSVWDVILHAAGNGQSEPSIAVGSFVTHDCNSANLI